MLGAVEKEGYHPDHDEGTVEQHPAEHHQLARQRPDARPGP
jgi:hypothetical protein